MDPGKTFDLKMSESWNDFLQPNQRSLLNNSYSFNHSDNQKTSKGRPGEVAHAEISARWEAEVADHVVSLDQHGKTPSLLKIQKLAGHGGGHL